jgi:phospholipase/lecithinase/hemolysin
MNFRVRQFVFVSIAILIVCGLLIGRTDAGPFTNLVVFGDSLSDIGNVEASPFVAIPGPYYWNGRFSNGPVYAETLATGLGLPALIRSTASGGTDYAYGGAKTTGTAFPDNLVVQDIDDQVGRYLSSRTPNATTLYVVFAGANDLLGNPTNYLGPTGNLQAIITELVNAGARKFLVFNLPPLGFTPRFGCTPSSPSCPMNTNTQNFNNELARKLDAIQTANPAVTIYRFDLASMFNQAIASPQSFGLTNVTAPAAPGLEPGDSSYNTSLIAPNVNEYLFWDDLHPTARVHAILGQRAVQMFYAAGDFNHDNQVDAADYLTWRKGAPAGFIQSDYNLWRANFGQTAGTGSGTDVIAVVTIPEPKTAILLILAACHLIAGRRPRIFTTPLAPAC